MSNERNECKKIMSDINDLLVSKKFDEVDKIISKLEPQKDSLRVFTSVIRCNFSYKNKLSNWQNKVEEFYLFYENTQNVNTYFIGLRE